MTAVDEPTTQPGGPAAGPAGAGADDRAVRRAVAREFRPRRAIPAVVVAVLLAAAAILAAIEVISRLPDRPAGILPVGRVARLGRETQWDDALTITAAVVAILAGLWLLWLALYPGRARVLALFSDRPRVVLAVSWPALRRVAARAAETVDGVERARARVGRRGVAVRVDTPLRDPGDLAGEVHAAVSDRIERLAPRPMPRVRVGVRRRED